MKSIMKIFSVLEKTIKNISVTGGYLLTALMLMIDTDVVMRLFGKSITGSVEIVAMSVPVLIFFGVGYTSLMEMHIRVDIIKRWPHMDRVTNLLCIAVTGSVGYYCVRQTFQTMQLSLRSTTLHIPRWPIVLITAIGMFIVVVAMIINEIKAYMRIFQKHGIGTVSVPGIDDLADQ